MTKSTPLSQLPYICNTDVAQRKQSNYETLPLPINTQLNQNVEEDEQLINEALQHIDTTPSSHPHQPIAINPKTSTDKLAQFEKNLERLQKERQAPLTPTQVDKNSIEYIQAQAYAQSQAAALAEAEKQSLPPIYEKAQSMPMPFQESDEDEYIEEDFEDRVGSVQDDAQDINTMPHKQKNLVQRCLQDFMRFNSEIKRVFIVMIVFAITTLIPIEATIRYYLNIDKIPYAHILVKSVFAGLLYFFLITLV